MSGTRLDAIGSFFIYGKRRFICLLFVALVCSCTKNIAMTDAYLVETSSKDGTKRSTGDQFQVNITLPREALAKISSNELYIHIHLVECSSGTFRATAAAFLDGKRMDRFEDLETNLKESSQEFYTITGVISDRLDWQSTCVTLTGGSYTLWKVRSDRVRLRWREDGKGT